MRAPFSPQFSRDFFHVRSALLISLPTISEPGTGYGNLLENFLFSTYPWKTRGILRKRARGKVEDLKLNSDEQGDQEIANEKATLTFFPTHTCSLAFVGPGWFPDQITKGSDPGLLYSEPVHRPSIFSNDCRSRERK